MKADHWARSRLPARSHSRPIDIRPHSSIPLHTKPANYGGDNPWSSVNHPTQPKSGILPLPHPLIRGQQLTHLFPTRTPLKWYKDISTPRRVAVFTQLDYVHSEGILGFMSLCVYAEMGILRYEGSQGTEAVPELCTYPRLRDRNDQHVSGSICSRRCRYRRNISRRRIG